ncbi:hypothetical protein GC176_20330 [bacterium]|nr:hypothetical protein [bacterium]
MSRRPIFRRLIALSLLVIPTVTFAEPLIPWPWLENSRYQTWKQERDAARADWYARRALDPVGSRRRYVKGKFWPPFPRPEGLSMLPSHRFHTAHYWPYPYVCEDRQSVREYFATQEDAGWEDATTLYDYHFDSDNQTLNRSGLLQLQWIIRNVPDQRRMVYVQAANDVTASNYRIANVQTEVSEMVGLENSLPVMLRVTSPLGRPAVEVDAIQRKSQSSMRIPRISAPVNTRASGGNSGASGGGGAGGSGGAGGAGM